MKRMVKIKDWYKKNSCFDLIWERKSTTVWGYRRKKGIFPFITRLCLKCKAWRLNKIIEQDLKLAEYKVPIYE